MTRPWFTSITLPCEERMGRRSLDIFEAQSRWPLARWQKTRLGNFKALQRYSTRAKTVLKYTPPCQQSPQCIRPPFERGKTWRKRGVVCNLEAQAVAVTRLDAFGVAFFSSPAMVVRCCLAQRFATDGSSTSACSTFGCFGMLHLLSGSRFEQIFNRCHRSKESKKGTVVETLKSPNSST